MRNNKILAALTAIVVSAFCAVICSANTQAISVGNYNTIVSRAKIADLYKCQPYFGDKIDILKLTQPSDILTGGGSNNILALPNGATKSDGLFNCKTLLNDYMGYSFSGNDNASKASFLKKMGYTVDTSAGSNMSCKKATFARYSDGSTLEYTVCTSLNQSKISSLNFSYDKGINGLTFANDGSILEVFADGASVGQIAYQGMSSDDFFSKLDGIFAGAHLLDFRYDGSGNSGMSDNGAAETDNIYKKGTLITNMVNSFPRDEQLGLLTYYFSKYGNISCYWTGGAVELTIGDNTYYVSKKSDAPSTFYVVDGSSWFGTTDWDGVISGLNGQDIDGIGDCENVEPPAADGSVDGGVVSNEADDDKPCFNGSGALGWILCPVIRIMRNAVDTLYENVITPFLAVETDVFNADSETYNGWKIFQNVANIAFVVFLLIIIFSQLTGYGIENYGIKRMLPRLIVAAVLTNLSFIICQLAVDISNILGVGLENMFEGMASGVGSVSVGAGKTVGATIISGAVGGAAAFGAISTIGLWGPLVIIPIFLGLISIIISIAMMFVTLGARKVIIVMLIVISPLAIVCYLLPNTKQYFDKWKKVFEAVLLVYPICGILMGGGAFVGALLWKVGGSGEEQTFLTQLLAALVTVIPFFFIPTILRNSMAGLGNLGARISGFGQRVARGGGAVAKMATQNAGWYKNVQDRKAETERNLERKRLEGVRDRINRTPESARTQKQMRQLALAQSQLNRMEAEDVEAEVGVRAKDRSMLKATAISRRYQEDVDAIKSQNVQSGLLNKIGEVSGYSGDGSDLTFEANTAVAQLYDFAKAGNQEGIAAATEQLSEKGHHGQEAVRQVLSKLQAEGGNEAAIQAISSAVMNNGKLASDYKSGARSSYDYMAKAAAGEIKGNINDLSTNQIKASNYSQQSFASMDKEELSRIEAGIRDGSISTEEAQKIQSLAQQALDNNLLQGGTKLKNEEVLNSIAGRSGQFDVRQNNGSSSGSQSTGAGAVVAGARRRNQPSNGSNDRAANVPYGAPSAPTGSSGENTDGSGI